MNITLMTDKGLILEKTVRGGYGFYGVGAPATVLDVTNFDDAEKVEIGEPVHDQNGVPVIFRGGRKASPFIIVDGVSFRGYTKDDTSVYFVNGGQTESYKLPTEEVELRDSEVIGINSVFKRGDQVVKVTKIQDIRYGEMYTPLGVRGPSLKGAGFTGEVIVVDGLDQYYDRIKVNLDRLNRAGWSCYEKTNEGANIRLD